ncbi:MAG: DNA-binding protein [Lachnospiraceae bacterium]|nr:DNA-binding protein [Lachnospiraceae bacterium]
MDSFAREALLYDFYGELLNEQQKRIFVAYAMEDQSLGEIASLYGISRQAVSGMLHRCRTALQEYEKKLGLIAKFDEMKDSARKIHQIAEKLDCPEARQIEKLTEEMTEAF